MQRRITPFEFEAAQGLKVEALEYLGEFFPRMSGVYIGICRDNGSVGVRAQIEDTKPYSRPEVIDALVQLGVSLPPAEHV